MKAILQQFSRIFTFLIVLGPFGMRLGQSAEFLIITADEFNQTIGNLAEWKYMKGISTEVVKLSEIDPSGSPSSEQIRDYISNLYYSWGGDPKYVLLVGDVSRIPHWTVNYTTSDNPYGDMEGDCKAEISVGRFAVSTIEACETMVAKNLAYERTPGLQGLAWLQKATLVMREDQQNNEPYYATMEYLNTLFTNYGYNTVDYLIAYNYGGGSDKWDVIDAIDEGRSFVVYRGSANPQTWLSPMDVHETELDNGWQLPIVISGTCYHGNFSQAVAFCNKWTQAGSAQAPRGAVAVLATSTVGAGVDLSWSRHFATRGFMEAIFDWDFTMLGSAFVWGKNYMYDNWYYERVREYNGWSLIGDPTLQICTSIPEYMAVQHPSVIEMNIPTDLTIIVGEETGEPIQDALVTIYKAGSTAPEIFEKENTDVNGLVVFENIVVPTSGVMHVTVTYNYWVYNYVPYQGEIQVYQMMTDDASALAYNGNRHLARKPGSEELHLVYTNDGSIVYRFSSNGGTDWEVPVNIGDGKFPAIALDSDHLPSVTWTDEEGGLWYRRKTTNSNWSDVYHLDNPTIPGDMHLNSPPSIAIQSFDPNIAHILVTRLGLIPESDGFGYAHTLEDFSFPISDPGQGVFTTIEEVTGLLEPPLRSFPSIARCEANNSLHAVWQRVDTICYAVKPSGGWWLNWNAPFSYQGEQSCHPFAETYGDSIYVVWHNDAEGEVYRGARHLQNRRFQWMNFSQTSVSSGYPVNASGFFTVYAEEPTAGLPYDIFYKVSPYDDRISISGTAYASLYPQSVARFALAPYLYTAWQDRDAVPYEIRFRKMRHQDHQESAFLTSISGLDQSSLYLVTRDGFVPHWRVPVDIGTSSTSYHFELEPRYTYKLRAVFYHEGSDSWCAHMKIDNDIQSTVSYDAYNAETFECWIPPSLYEDGAVTVSFNRVVGDFVATGPIHIYRYEHDGVGDGAASQPVSTVNSSSIAIFPNPFKEQLNIVNQTLGYKQIDLKLYDASGRFVRQFNISPGESFSHIIWDGIDSRGRAVPQGVYFLRIGNLDSDEIQCHKVLRVE